MEQLHDEDYKKRNTKTPAEQEDHEHRDLDTNRIFNQKYLKRAITKWKKR